MADELLHKHGALRPCGRLRTSASAAVALSEDMAAWEIGNGALLRLRGTRAGLRGTNAGPADWDGPLAPTSCTFTTCSVRRKVDARPKKTKENTEAR